MSKKSKGMTPILSDDAVDFLQTKLYEGGTK
jgi:hypothetical protein